MGKGTLAGERRLWRNHSQFISGRDQTYNLTSRIIQTQTADTTDAARSTCAKKYKRAQDLKAHRTRTDHKDIDDAKITKTAVATAKVKKIEERTASYGAKSNVGLADGRKRLTDQIPQLDIASRPEDLKCQM